MPMMGRVGCVANTVDELERARVGPARGCTYVRTHLRELGKHLTFCTTTCECPPQEDVI